MYDCTSKMLNRLPESEFQRGDRIMTFMIYVFNRNLKFRLVFTFVVALLVTLLNMKSLNAFFSFPTWKREEELAFQP